MVRLEPWYRARTRSVIRPSTRPPPRRVPLYLGDDITDEDAFRALRGRGVGILVGRPDDPDVAGRATAAEFVLASTGEVEQFLTGLGC
ncbi:hypothetical protein [Planosporangium sp. 12N6]|uniref:hypothetical protein n=1 Tax=Planosporangium spinosum TaxID=3402278 RepID=UPI003CF97986